MASRLGDKFTGRISSSLERKYKLQTVRTEMILPQLYVVKTDAANFYILQSGDCTICFDTGYRPLVVKDQLKTLHIDPEKVTHVFLTHADVDHVSGLGVFSNAAVYLSSKEEPLIKGIRSIRSAIRSPRIRRDYHLLHEGDIITTGTSSVKAIETPGHTPGSMAYLVDDTYLFLGDTCKLKDGEAYAGKYFTMDYETQKDSIRKLARLENVGWVFTGHSGYTDDFNKAFEYWR